MTEEKWLELTGKVKDSFEVIDQGEEDLADGPGKVQYIIFNGPVGKMKLALTVKPVVLEEKAIGSRRIGSDKTIRREYSETEFVRTLKVFRYDEATDDWQEMEAGDTFKVE